MKRSLIILLGFFVLLNIVSCTNVDQQKSTKKQKDAEKLYQKYKSMITKGDGCEPCADCAALALAISYDTSNDIKINKKKLIEYYKKNGTIPCPELVPEITEKIAQIQK